MSMFGFLDTVCWLGQLLEETKHMQMDSSGGKDEQARTVLLGDS